MDIQIDITETFIIKKETTRSAFRWLWLIHLGSSRILGYSYKLSLSWYMFILFSICNSYMFSPRRDICERGNLSPWYETRFSLSLTSRVQLNDLCIILITFFRWLISIGAAFSSPVIVHICMVHTCAQSHINENGSTSQP